jgi:hypothetical protein
MFIIKFVLRYHQLLKRLRCVNNNVCVFRLDKHSQRGLLLPVLLGRICVISPSNEPMAFWLEFYEIRNHRDETTEKRDNKCVHWDTLFTVKVNPTVDLVDSCVQKVNEDD